MIYHRIIIRYDLRFFSSDRVQMYKNEVWRTNIALSFRSRGHMFLIPFYSPLYIVYIHKQGLVLKFYDSFEIIPLYSNILLTVRNEISYSGTILNLE